jgi:hypothetical protein
MSSQLTLVHGRSTSLSSSSSSSSSFARTRHQYDLRNHHPLSEMYNSVEEELWKIFTFYSIHADSHQPEVMRAASFVRFCRDTQIVSRKIKPTTVELEVARVVCA